MGSKRNTASRRAKLAAWIEERRPAIVREEHWQELRTLLAPVSESHLRRLLRKSGLDLEPLIEGVRQEDFHALERSLTALETEYRAAGERGDRQRVRECRRLVVTAKDHARWAASRAKRDDQRKQKQEMAEWMLVWLENPPLFRDWVQLRRRAAAGQPGELDY